MGLYFRKSLNLGGLRLNLSKSGVGFSTGVRGFRIGVNARGQQYVSCGFGGIYYRQFLGGSRRVGPTQSINQPQAAPPSRRPTAPQGWPVTPAPIQPQPWQPPIPSGTVGPEMRIDSGDVSAMVDATSKDLLDEIRRRHRRIRWHLWFAMACTAGFCIALTKGSTALAVFSAVLFAVGTPLLWWMVHQRKRVVRLYQLDPAYAERYRRILDAFEMLRRSQRIWNIQTHAEVLDPKYHAGASELMRRASVVAGSALPPYFKSNVVPPRLPAGRQTLYFFPDCIFVFDGWDVGVIGYGQLDVRACETRFIEDERPPGDSTIVGQRWRYVNKNGTPDRRFSNNRRLPVMLYGELSLRSQTGLNELFHVSRPDSARAVEIAFKTLTQITTTPQTTTHHGTPRPPPIAPQPWPTIR
jgi:hypothetical protein